MSLEKTIALFQQDTDIDFALCPTFLTLRDQHQVFVLAYCLAPRRNATEAARTAEYAERSARQQGSRLLTNDDISEAVNEITAIINTSKVAQAQEIREFLTMIMRGSVMDICRWTEEGLVLAKNSDQMDEEKARLIKVLKINTTKKGDVETMRAQLEMHDPVKAAELLGKDHGLFKETVENTHIFKNLDERLEDALEKRKQ